MIKAQPFDVFYSEYFKSWCQIIEIFEDGFFSFKLNAEDVIKRSQITIGYLEEHNYLFRRIRE